MILHCESTHESMICTHRLTNFLHSNYTNCRSVTSCRLGGVIAAYKIVPDEIDEIKVLVFIQEMDTNMLFTHLPTDTDNVFPVKRMRGVVLNFVCVFYMRTGDSFGVV